MEMSKRLNKNVWSDGLNHKPPPFQNLNIHLTKFILKISLDVLRKLAFFLKDKNNNDDVFLTGGNNAADAIEVLLLQFQGKTKKIPLFS